jgi:enoyl-CoA hydratase/carnithine racemase
VPEKASRTATKAKRIHLQLSPDYWRVTLDHPPLNIFGPETIPQLNEIITALETDKDVKVVVFDSGCRLLSDSLRFPCET